MSLLNKNKAKRAAAKGIATNHDDRVNLAELLGLVIWLLLAVLTFLSFQIGQLMLLLEKKFRGQHSEPVFAREPESDLDDDDQSRAAASFAVPNFPPAAKAADRTRGR